ncbi:hypothetical protein CP532_6058 [Ophiocordyceps camponoti-leonardi (nom. inval.)]|nr:hypothetical protein CP532_6058 [Ophiocordyceps camponoti-leonardi (nom. inval.)]
MSDKIPPLVANLVSDRAKRVIDVVAKFVQEDCMPADAVLEAQLGTGEGRWDAEPSIMEELKTKARRLGLWNMFLPKGLYAESGGWSNVEYGLMAEWLGRSRSASEACNCSAPDTGNMEVLAKYGNAAQKETWLRPLLEGKTRSAFLMTEPGVASSDATNIQMTIRREGNEYVLNGEKWWSSGAGDARCGLYLVVGRSNPENADVHRRQSIVLVPADSKGITIRRMLRVYGYDDAPHGHGHLSFTNVRVPVSNLVLGEGRGFEILQGRLGPGRIHHAMRCIGACEVAIEWMLMRINDPSKKPFGKLLREHGVVMEWIARSRIETNSARLVVLNAAARMDASGGAKAALSDIAIAKVVAPSTALRVIDRAVQALGAAGVCQDSPLAAMWANIRTLRIADGPDEVHLQQLGKAENRREGQRASSRIEELRRREGVLLERFGLARAETGSGIVRAKI